MSRELFKAVEPQKPETKAFIISGGTEKERFEKMRNLISELGGRNCNIHGSGAQIGMIVIKQGGSLEDVTIENPVLLLIEPKENETERTIVHGYKTDEIEQLAKEQGNTIDL